MRRAWVIPFLLWASMAFGVEPDEILADAALETRARALSEGLRCPVCQNESIDESNAPIARDLRILLRERLVAGDTDAQVVDFLVARYGEFVLLQPDARGANLLLWVSGPVLLALGLLVAWRTVRRRPPTSAPKTLTTSESEALEKIMRS